MSNPRNRQATTSVRISRRRLLGLFGAGAGAAVVAGTPIGGALSSIPAAHSATTQTSPTTFGRLFPNLPPFAQATDPVKAALVELGKPGGLLDAADDLSAGPIRLIADLTLSTNNPNNPTHTAGTTFFGQFIDHDITFDVGSPLGVPTEPSSARNSRTPSLDLDSVYGGGPIASAQLYDPGDHAKLLVGFGGIFEDLPRTQNNVAVIGDPRNDENLIIAGLHSAFLLFHNKAVDTVRENNAAHLGRPGVQGSTPSHHMALPVACDPRGLAPVRRPRPRR